MPAASRYDALPSFRCGRERVEKGELHLASGFEIPFAVIEASEPGAVLLLTAGVHGSEFCSIEAVLRLLRKPPQLLRGTLVILPILNIQGFRARSLFVMPEDGRNLNHVFPGTVDGTTSERLAHWLTTQVFPRVDAYVDLHNGDLIESLMTFTIFPADSAASAKLAGVFGAGIAVASPGAGFAIQAASRLGVPSIIAEVGGNGLWSEHQIEVLYSGLNRVMHHLNMIPPLPHSATSAEKWVTKWDPRADCDGIWYPSKILADPVESGELLGKVTDIFGNTLQEVRAPQSGFILYLLTSLSVRKGEALLGVASPRSQ
jgi:uncharacterized protein